MADSLICSQLGQYRLIEEVGCGGMATIYKAYQPSLDRFVAVKVMHRSDDLQFAMRFKREARAIASLQHHNILPIYDYGEQDGWLYFVLQYIEGGTTLASLLFRPFSAVAALRLIGHVLVALDYAHTRGIIHRDVKPTNILMAAPDWPMLADFGIARLASEEQRLTLSGSIVGTAAYMAPEQALGRPVDARTDIYATGVMLYEMLTGQIPFDGDTPVVMLTKHVVESPLPPRRVNPSLSPLLEAVVLRAIAKNPADRFQTAAEMADELGWIASHGDRPLATEELLDLYDSGVEAFANGQWGLAIARLARVLTIDPNHEDARDLLDAAREQQQAHPAADQQPTPIEQVPRQTVPLPSMPDRAMPPLLQGQPRRELHAIAQSMIQTADTRRIPALPGSTPDRVILPAQYGDRNDVHDLPQGAMPAANMPKPPLTRKTWGWPAFSLALVFILVLGAIDMHQGADVSGQLASMTATPAGIPAPPALLMLGQGLINFLFAPAQAAELPRTPTVVIPLLVMPRGLPPKPLQRPTTQPNNQVERSSRGAQDGLAANPGTPPATADQSGGLSRPPQAPSGTQPRGIAVTGQAAPPIIAPATSTATLPTSPTPRPQQATTPVAAMPTPAQQPATALPAIPTPAPTQARATNRPLPAVPSPTHVATPSAIPSQPPAPTAVSRQPSAAAQPTQPPSRAPTQAPTATPRPPATSRPAATATSRPTATPRPAATATPRPAATATPRPAATTTPRPTTTPQPVQPSPTSSQGIPVPPLPPLPVPSPPLPVPTPPLP